MKSVKIEVDKLLEHLRANRENHEEEFKEAMVVYRQLMVCKLTEMLEAAKDGKDVNHVIHIDRPTSFLSSYDEAIQILEWTTDSVVELDRGEFKQYVQDEWSWKNGFSAMASTYKGLSASLN